MHGEEKKMVENIKNSLLVLERREQDLINMKNKYSNDNVEDISDNTMHVDETIPTIDDIKQYFEQYCTKHNHTVNNVTTTQLNDILLPLGYQSENIHGKNYLDTIRKKNSPTWAITLSPDLLN